MNKKIISMLDTNVNRLVVFAIIFFTFGILFTLSLRYLKYTEYITPTISDINPVEAYQNIHLEHVVQGEFHVQNPHKYHKVTCALAVGYLRVSY